MSVATKETLEFRSELRQMLDLITHSLYSHEEVFLRELISNAADAIDRLRFRSLTDGALLGDEREFAIRLVADKDARTLTVSDNGVGMTRDEAVENLGTIARSGTKAFLASLSEVDARNRPELIGQFGVGFYSAFMVADTVTVVSKAAGPGHEAVRWASDGKGSFTVEPAERTARGTDVVLHLKEDKTEFLETWKLRQLVKQFSDFVEHPVITQVDGKDETLNSQKAVWLRPKSEVTKDEYAAFYRQVSHDVGEPAKVLHYMGEGTTEFKVLLFIPATKPFDLRWGEAKVGPRLYVRRVLVMDHCEALLPPYLRFVKGVVDCADLPLNVSRELLQQNPLLSVIQKNLVRNVLRALAELKKDEPEVYATFFAEMGSVLKEGLARDHANAGAIADLLLFESTKTEKGKTTTLAAYVEGMPEAQKEIYYLTGESRAQVENAPVLEGFRASGFEVLLLTDPIDELVLPSFPEYKEKPLRAVDRADVDAAPEGSKPTEEEEAAFKPLLARLGEHLPSVKEVRLSRRLTESAACLVAAEGEMGAHLERLLAHAGHGEGSEAAKRVLELNARHPLVAALRALHAARPDDPRVELYGGLLYEEALLAEGGRLADPASFARRVNEVLQRDAEAAAAAGGREV